MTTGAVIHLRYAVPRAKLLPVPDGVCVPLRPAAPKTRQIPLFHALRCISDDRGALPIEHRG
jgi:hypothetical protein